MERFSDKDYEEAFKLHISKQELRDKIFRWIDNSLGTLMNKENPETLKRHVRF